MTSMQPELWVDRPSAAVAFYEAGFGARVLHMVGEGDHIVAQLAVDDAAFWVASTSESLRRLSPIGAGASTTGRSSSMGPMRNMPIFYDIHLVIARSEVATKKSRLRDFERCT